MGDLQDPKQNGDQWAKLPPHERDRILQSMTEGFPPSYRNVLERYYRRLADEKSTGEPGVENKADQNKPAENKPVESKPTA